MAYEMAVMGQPRQIVLPVIFSLSYHSTAVLGLILEESMTMICPSEKAPVQGRLKIIGLTPSLVIAWMLGCLLAGCSQIGPATIRSGRLAYNEAITETNNQQMLMFVILNRYEETGSLLAVANITANVNVRTNAGIQLGFGDSDNYAGNLVPFRAGTLFEENPTISYTPVAGAKYAKLVFSPVSLPLLIRMTGALNDPSHVYKTLVSSINGVQNPDFQSSSIDPNQHFSRIVRILTSLTQAHRLHWIVPPEHPDKPSVVMDHYAPTHTAEVIELLNLFGLPAPTDHTARIILPISFGLDGSESAGLGITTRSIADLVEILSAAIEIPEWDRQKGVATSYPPPGLAGEGLRIHFSKVKPESASVAVEYRDGWFYIDEGDLITKRFFRLLSALWSSTIAECTARGYATPLLTLPVHR